MIKSKESCDFETGKAQHNPEVKVLWDYNFDNYKSFATVQWFQV